MEQEDGSLKRTLSVAAVALTAVAVLLPPSIYFAVSYQHTAGSLDAEAEINSRILSRIVTANPQLWAYEQVRFSEYLGRRPGTGEPERRRVLDARGAVVAEDTDPLRPPWLTRSASLYDSGVPVGRIEISRSLWPIILRSGALGAVLLAIGAASFRAVRTLPLRALDRSEAALRRERDSAQRYLDVAGVAFVIADEAGRVKLVNRMGCELLGRPEGDVLGRDWTSTFVDPADRARAASASAAATTPGRVVSLEYSVVRPDGERRRVSWYVTPLSEDGHRTGLLASGVDRTHERHLEDQLRKAQRLEAIGRLAGGLAHDYNNVLTVIRMKADLLRRQMGEKDARSRYVEDILGSTDRAASLTRDLLTFGRQRDLRREELDVVELLRRIEPSLRCLLRDGVELRSALAPEPLRVTADPMELERVLMNLVSNARDAMPAGGRIVVSAARTVLDGDAAFEAGLEAAGAYAEIAVADTGAGIPPDVQAKLFEPFFTTKEPGKGTGLGLSISYAIVKQHDGAIRVASKPGRGATFALLLPLLPERA